MINEINHATSKQIITPITKVFHRPDEYDKIEKSDDQRSEHTTTKNVIENGILIVEQYDRNGQLIRKTPSGYLSAGQKG